MSAQETVGSLPWIPNDAAREKYERAGEKTACGLQELTGPVVDYGTRDRYEGDGTYDVITLDVPNVGRVAIHCQATVLERQMHSARPFKFGTILTVRYLGEVTGRNDRPYHNYEVVTDRPMGGEIPWADGFSATPAAPAVPTGEVPAAASAPQADDDIPF